MTLSTEHKENDPGHLREHDLFAAAYNAIAWMPPPSTPAANFANFKAALADVIGDYGFAGTLQFPPGYYVFEAGIVAEDALGLTLRGVGDATRLVFNNMTDGADWLTLAHCQRAYVGDMQLLGAGSGLARAAIATVRTDASGMTYAPSQNLFSRIAVNGGNRIDTGFLVGGNDANNDFHCVEHSVLQGYTGRGIDLRAHSQSYNNEFRNLRCYGGAGAEYAVDARGDFCGTALWHGGFVNNHQVADFGLGGWYQPWLIEGVNSEGSKRFITMNSSVRANAIVRACRYAANAIHDDLTAIIVDGARHQFTLENCEIGDSSGDKALQLRFQNNAVVKMEMNVVYSSAASVFSHQVPGQLYGNQQCTNEGAQTRVPLTGEAITPSAAIVDAAP